MFCYLQYEWAIIISVWIDMKYKKNYKTRYYYLLCLNDKNINKRYSKFKKSLKSL